MSYRAGVFKLRDLWKILRKRKMYYSGPNSELITKPKTVLSYFAES